MILVYLLAAAVAVGYLRGGRLSRYALCPLRGLWLPVAAFLIEACFAFMPHRALYVAVPAQYACLFAFLWFNRDRKPLWAAAAGTATNFAAMCCHAMRMPVSPAIYGFASLAPFVNAVQQGRLVEYVLVDYGAPLWFLGDAIPIPWGAPGVASVGDFLLGAGLFWLIQQIMTAAPAEA